MTLSDTRPAAGSTSGADRSIPSIVADLRGTFRSGRTRPLEWRIGQLHALERLVKEREKEFVAALQDDLGRNATDAWLADLAPVRAESVYARRHLKSWAKPQRV